MTTTTTWTRQDLRGTLRAVGEWWDLLVDGLDEDLLRTPPRPGAPTISELRATDLAARSMLTPGDVTDDDAPLVEATLARLSAAGRAVMALGAGAPRAHGEVVGLQASDGGVPKLPRNRVTVGYRGVDGDRQASRQHHGRVWQALCLWSSDVIDSLVAEGHDLAPGRAGDNVTVRGIDWATLRPGTRLRIGTVLAEVSLPTDPCVKNKRWFLGGDFMRMSRNRERGVTRWYASVVEPGQVAVGDVVVVEP